MPTAGICSPAFSEVETSARASMLGLSHSGSLPPSLPPLGLPYQTLFPCSPGYPSLFHFHFTTTSTPSEPSPTWPFSCQQRCWIFIYSCRNFQSLLPCIPLVNATIFAHYFSPMRLWPKARSSICVTSMSPAVKTSRHRRSHPPLIRWGNRERGTILFLVSPYAI